MALVLVLLLAVAAGTAGAQETIRYVAGPERPMLWLGTPSSDLCNDPDKVEHLVEHLKDLCTSFEPGRLELGTRVVLLPEATLECTEMVAILVLDGASQGKMGCIADESLTSAEPDAKGR